MTVRSAEDLEALKRVGKVVAATLAELTHIVAPGMTTADVDRLAAEVLARFGARSAPNLLYGFPGTICISVNDEAVHGVPGPRTIEPWDIVTLDVTAELDGYIADAAVTVPMPEAGGRSRALVRSASTALEHGIAAARAGRRLSDIGRAVSREVHRGGFSVLAELSGHGVGRAIHEPPDVPNFYHPSIRTRLHEGLVIAVEPIISTQARDVVKGDDGWTLRTSDGSPAAHFEHTIVVTAGKPLVLTAG